MSTQQNANKTRAALVALAASAAVAAGTFAFSADIESKVANLAGVNLSQLKSTDNPVLANAVQTARETTDAAPTSTFDN